MEYSLSQIVRSFWSSIARIILFLVLLLLIPLGLPFAIVWLFIFRSLATKFAHVVYGKNIGKLLTTRGACSAQDQIYKKPLNNIVVKLKFSGHIEIQELRDLIRLRLLQQYLPGAEEKYPELRQYVFPFLGYYFWRNCESFDICEHVKEVKLLPQGKTNQQSNQVLNGVVQNCVNEPWIEGKPLWEVNLINLKDSSEGKEESALIFKIHHSLADGFSIWNLLRNDLCGNDDQLNVNSTQEREVPMSKPSVRTFGQRVVYITSFLFKVSWDMSQILLECLLPSDWKPKRLSQNQTWNIISEKVPIKKLQDIKNHFKVSFSSLLINLASGGIRNALVGLKNDGDRSFDKVLCLIPLPLFPRGPKLRNFMAESLLCLPVELSDTVERLGKCNEIVQSTTRSPSIEFLTWIFMILGSTPNFLANFLLHHMPATAILSNFSGGTGDACISTSSGNKIMCTDASFTMGLTNPTMGTGFTILSYGKFVRFSVIVNKSLYSKQQAEQLLSEILMEMEKLQGLLV